MERSVYASKVVANALKPRSKLWVWLGAQTLLVWVITTFLPHTFPVSCPKSGVRHLIPTDHLGFFVLEIERVGYSSYAERGRC
jgi:hypothetical protein